jgi:hypothetical protein
MTADFRKLAEPSRVKEIVLSRTEEELVVRIRLVPEGGIEEADYVFRGVGDLRFRGERTDLTQIVALAIEDITNFGWDGVRYRVRDYEEEFVSFLCQEVAST